MKTLHTKAVTLRFLQACAEIVATQRGTGGPISTNNAMALSLGTIPQNFSRLRTQGVNTELCAALCKLYKVNGHWLLTGTGQRFLTDKPEDLSTILGRIEALERDVKYIGKSHQTPVKRPSKK